MNWKSRFTAAMKTEWTATGDSGTKYKVWQSESGLWNCTVTHAGNFPAHASAEAAMGQAERHEAGKLRYQASEMVGRVGV